MLVAVLGSIVDDTIVTSDGSVCRSFGGLAYSVGALQALAGPDIEIMPLCRVGTEVRDRLLEQWRQGGRLPRLDGLVAVPGLGARVELDYRSRRQGERQERLLGPVLPLGRRELLAAHDADALLVNCVSGFDVELEPLEELAAAIPRVHLDIHSLTLGLSADGVRYLRRPPELRRWLALADVVQCNATEADTMISRDGEWDELVAQVGTRAVAVIVTRGASGAMLLRPARTPVPVAAPRIDAVDPTGAGDTFGAAFVLERLRGASLREATRTAVSAATQACRLRGSAALRQLRRPQP